MMEKNLSKFVEAAARECYYLNINGNLLKEICLIILDQNKIDILNITDQITEKYQYLFYHNCFSDLVTLTSLASIDHHFLLRKIPIYNFVIASSFRIRNFINEKNHVFIDENIFNYFINILNQDIDNIKLGNIDNIYDYMPKSDDEFFHTYLKTIDYFISKHQISVPKKVMDGYYKDESRHYKKIKHLLI